MPELIGRDHKRMNNTFWWFEISFRHNSKNNWSLYIFCFSYTFFGFLQKNHMIIAFSYMVSEILQKRTCIKNLHNHYGIMSESADCYLRQEAHPAWQGAGGTEFARIVSRTLFLRWFYKHSEAYLDLKPEKETLFF